MLQHIKTFIVFSIVLLVISGPASATKILIINDDEKKSLSGTIKHGADPIDIRVFAIRDRELISAIRKGAHSRRIRILIDITSPEIESISGFKNIEIRISSQDRRGKFGNKAMEKSFLMARAKGHYLQWYGNLTWTGGAFGTQVRYICGSWTGLGQSSRTIAKTFDDEFSLALTLKQPALIIPEYKPSLL